MALVVADRVKQTAASISGTGTYTLSGTFTGFQTFTDGVGDGNTTYYAAIQDANFEIGIGTYTASGATLARTTILQSSNSDNAVSWSSATPTIFTTYPADKAVFKDASGNINGTFVGNITGNVTGNTSGTAATVTGAAQTNITSVGTLSSLTTSGDITVGDDLTINGGQIDLKTNSGAVAKMLFYCESGNAHAQTIQAQPHSASSSSVLTLPVNTGTLVGTGDSGSVSNTMLGGSIANSKLANSSINFGGISLALGASDTTPAFDLTDATNYPTSSLSGTITNAQLAGSIANSKLANDSVSFGGISLDLGASDATPAFDLSDATNYPTSSLSGTITNAQLAGSIANTKLANSSITVADPSSSTAISLGETITFLGTTNEVEVSEGSGTITVGLPNNVTIAGNLTVNGTTTTIDTTNTLVKDSLLGLNNGASSNSNDSGIIIERGSTGNDALLIWDESADKWALGTTTSNASSTGNLNMTTGTLVANIEGNVTGDVTGNTSGTAATVTGAAQSNITSLGTLTGLAVNGDVTITSTDGGATDDPSLILYRNSSSPADSDDLGEILFRGRNDNSQDVEYAKIFVEAKDVSDGTEDGSITFQAMKNGTLYTLLSLNGNADQIYVSSKINMQTNNINNVGTLMFEGATGDAHETTITVVDPTADRTITLPDATGTVLVQDSTNDVTITSTDAGATEDPSLILYRNSASPADDDNIGTLKFIGRNDNSQDVVYGEIQSVIQDASDGTEDSFLNLQVCKDGSATTFLNLSGSSGRVNIQQELFLTTGVQIRFEGATSNSNETALTATDPTADRTITLPDASGTVLVQDSNDDVIITSTDSGATDDPSLILYRNSSSPADSDDLGEILFRGRNDNSQDVEYVKIWAEGYDVSDGTEDGKFYIDVMTNGTLTNYMNFLSNYVYFNKDIHLWTNRNLVFEGATADGNETFLTATDPTQDNTITLPDATGTVITTGNTSDVTTVGTLTTLTVDNVIINGSTIGHTGDTDLMTVASGVLTVAGEVSMTTLDIGGTNVTATAAELNILDGVTATASELNIMDGVTATTAELNYSDGVTSAIQTQLDAKATKGFATAMAIAL